MANTQVNIRHETQVFLPQKEFEDDIDETHHKSHPSKQKKSTPKNETQFQGVPSDVVVASHAKESRWKSIRVLLLALVLLILIGCIIGVILMIIFYPKCPHKPNLEWWQKETAYQIEVSNYKDTNDDGIGDVDGVISQIDYLNELGVKTLILSRVLSKETPREFDSEYGNIAVLDSLKQKLKDNEMHLIIDMPASFLDKNDKETIEYWLENYADGLRITNLNDLSTDESVQDGFMNKWRQLAENISKKSLTTKLITAYPNDKKSISYERRFLLLNQEQLTDSAKFTAQIDDLYKSLDKATWPVLVLGDYESVRLKSKFSDSKLSRLAHGLIMLLRGTTLTLFGDEIELTGTSEYENTMQWSSSPGCGFTQNENIGQFFRDATNNCANNVNEESQSSSSLISLYKNLAILKKEPTFLWGDVKVATQGKEDIISFVRQANHFETYLVAANTGDQTVVVNLKDKHSLADKAVVSLVYSFNNESFDFKVNDEIGTDSVQIKTGQLLVLKFKKM